ncbi:MAG TPA: L,D-transpeptidase family protein [Acidobacteriaceae bacterium]|nr:L,D-transpeptidase family protein [Acidobacteriaceae bacterium]
MRRFVIFAVICGVALLCRGQETAIRADRIVIVKSAHRMTLMSRGREIRSYKVALGDPIGPKVQRGDKKTPEGVYFVDGKNANSLFHRALHLSYPNAADRARARKMGVNPGGDIEIHGLPRQYAWMGAAHRSIDWTTGCIAVTNAEIDEIWEEVRVGTAVEIRP